MAEGSKTKTVSGTRDLGFTPGSYWNERLTRNFNLTGVGYQGLGIGFNRVTYHLRRIMFRSVVSRFGLAKVDRVIDIGSGTGFCRLWLDAGAREVDGVDLAEVAVESLGRLFPHCRFHHLDIGRELPAMLKARFDAVSAFDVLFHIVDDRLWRNAISNLADLLRPGGYLLLSESFLHGAEMRIEHQVSRRLETIYETLQANRLEIVERRPMLVLMNYPVDSDSIILRTLWWAITFTAWRSEVFSWFWALLLYPLERILLLFVRESPTTEVLVARKVVS